MAFNATTKPIYGNCQILSQDGVLLSRANEKRVNWYLVRNLAIKLSDNPLTIKLLFKHAGYSHRDLPFFLQKRQNICVVCGAKEELSRHHIVPYCYRHYFSEQFKEYCMHDVLPLCLNCHKKCEELYDRAKYRLASKYKVELHQAEVPKDYVDIFKLRSICRTIFLHEDKIPKDRVECLISRISEILKHNPLPSEIEYYAKLKQPKINNKYKHGFQLVDKLKNIQKFIVFWRKMFLKLNKPKYMPLHWDVNLPTFEIDKP